MLAAIALSLSSCAKKQPVTSPQAACVVATARVTAVRDLPISHVALCDEIPEAASPDGYYIMALRARCSEDLCGSTLMGWFAVQKATGDVFEVDPDEWKIGSRVARAS